MPNQNNGSNYPIVATPVFPATLAASGTYSTAILPLPGPGIIFCATSTQAGAITLQRFADAAGLIPVDLAAVSQALTASTAANLAINDGRPALYFQATITNTSGSTATLSGLALVCSGTPA